MARRNFFTEEEQKIIDLNPIRMTDKGFNRWKKELKEIYKTRPALVKDNMEYLYFVSRMRMAHKSIRTNFLIMVAVTSAVVTYMILEIIKIYFQLK